MVGAKLNTCYQRCNAGIYLLGYLVCPRALIQVPHAAIASLALRLDSQSHSQSNTYSTILPNAQGPTGLSVCSAGVLGLAPSWSHIMAWRGNVVSGTC